jgi:arginyl-tRNA synthetase
MIVDHLADLVRAAIESAASDGLISASDADIEFEHPRKREHGDWATNVALKLGGGGDPRSLAQELVDRLPESELVDRVEVAGPGFLNFHLAPSWLHDPVRRAATPGSGFGRSKEGQGLRVNVEYVSANPTGPLNVVSGRHAAVGDVISNLLAATGHEVTREYYFNDAGRQMRLFGASVGARYLQLFDRDAPVPEDGYHGEYLIDVAREVKDRVGDEFVDLDGDALARTMLDLSLPGMLEMVQATLDRFGSHFDVWASERALYDRGEVERAIDTLDKAGYMEEREGARWFLSTRFGDDKDRVVIRSNGEPTYLASDLGYLLDKFDRGFDRAIYLWGADHHGTVKRVKGAAEVLVEDAEKVEIMLLQIVSLFSGGEALKASKRAGVLVPLDELIDEVGVDAARYTFLTRSMDAPLEFDLELAKQEAPENPVYYVQYQHARICSILRKAAEEGVAVDVQNAPLDLLVDPSEDELMRKIASYEEVVPDAAQLRAPQKMTRFVEELASLFSAFYQDHRVIGEDPGLTRARLALCVATRSVIADVLGLLGVSAPERM